ncbi:MAG TPA: DUF4407 domain-containing protein [Cyclobacteriaceae bacterium]|nr:DUF4407 domain-containing protein [Cyclobacteriaceae bacterium]
MQKITRLFLLASGADLKILEQCPSDRNKYAGIGATIFFTGLFAAMAAAYALFTVFDSYWIAILLGLLWGSMIFNLDRYIVSSMRKDSRRYRELLTALPRIVLAVLISIVIARPLELKIFGKEIESELIVMEQQVYARQENELKGRYDATLVQLRQEVETLKSEIAQKSSQRDALVLAAQQEADGTGGSKRRNLGPIYKVKKTDADEAEKEVQSLIQTNSRRIAELETRIDATQHEVSGEIGSLARTRLNGPAARLEALSRLTEQSPAMWWAHIFIMILFLIIESAPILVKLISRSGPYDSLLHVTEHKYRCNEVEAIAIETAEVKKRTGGLPQTEQGYVTRKLDAELT